MAGVLVTLVSYDTEVYNLVYRAYPYTKVCNEGGTAHIYDDQDGTRQDGTDAKANAGYVRTAKPSAAPYT